MFFSVLGEVVTAYVLTDLGAAIYHFITDRGWNTKRIVAQFLNHHNKPETMSFDLEPMIGGLPILYVGVYFHSVLTASIGLFICFSQIPHYYTHHPAPVFIRVLQNCGIILSPEKHAIHHREFNRNFCVISGWTNPLFNYLLNKAGF